MLRNRKEEPILTKIQRWLTSGFSDDGLIELKRNGTTYVDPDKLFSQPEGRERLQKASGSLDALENND